MMKRVRVFDVEDQHGHGHASSSASSYLDSLSIDDKKKRRSRCPKKLIFIVLLIALGIGLWYWKYVHNETPAGTVEESDGKKESFFRYKIPATKIEKEGAKPKDVFCKFTTPDGENNKEIPWGHPHEIQHRNDCVACTACTSQGMTCTVHYDRLCKHLEEDEEDEDDDDYEEDEEDEDE